MTDPSNPITMIAMVIRHLSLITPAAVLMGSALYAWLYLTDEYHLGIAYDLPFLRGDLLMIF